MKTDSFGTVWYTDGPDGEPVPVDPAEEFGNDWPGHAHDEDDENTTAPGRGLEVKP